MAQQNLKTDLNKLNDFGGSIQATQTYLDTAIVKQVVDGLHGKAPYPDFGELPEAHEMGAHYADACGEIAASLQILSTVLGDLQDSVKKIHQMYANADQSVQMSSDSITKALSGLDAAFPPPKS